MAPWVEGQLIIEWESERQHGSQGTQAAPGAGVWGERKAALFLTVWRTPASGPLFSLLPLSAALFPKMTVW